MASLREKVEAELEQIDQALRLLPEARRVTKLSALELGGTASLLSSVQISGRAVTGEGPKAKRATAKSEARRMKFERAQLTRKRQKVGRTPFASRLSLAKGRR